MWGARNRARTRHSQLVAVLGVSVMAEFACWPAGALGDSALSTDLACGVFVILLSMLVFSLVVAVSTFEQRTVGRYNNTQCTYCVNLQHGGSISELHCIRSKCVHTYLPFLVQGLGLCVVYTILYD
jgi:hypothetical protein